METLGPYLRLGVRSSKNSAKKEILIEVLETFKRLANKLQPDKFIYDDPKKKDIDLISENELRRVYTGEEDLWLQNSKLNCYFQVNFTKNIKNPSHYVEFHLPINSILTEFSLQEFYEIFLKFIKLLRADNASLSLVPHEGDWIKGRPNFIDYNGAVVTNSGSSTFKHISNIFWINYFSQIYLDSFNCNINEAGFDEVTVFENGVIARLGTNPEDPFKLDYLKRKGEIIQNLGEDLFYDRENPLEMRLKGARRKPNFDFHELL